MKVGVVGQGFVGSAIRTGLENFYEVLTYDIDEKLSKNSHEDVCVYSDIIFVCVPTPMRKDGSCDIRILEGALNHIDWQVECGFVNGTIDTNPVVVIKSTIPPGTTEKLFDGLKFKKIQLCFSPEFLTEANSFEDFKNQTRIIIGGPRPATGVVKQMFRKAFPTIPIIKTGTKTAEMVKYFTNCFLASKVTFANQMFQICNDNNIDYDKVCEYALYDERIGKSHLAVPGPDGDLGFGGHCFPKDLAAMISFGSINNGETDFLEAVQEFNNKVRRIRDWEKMKGRAVSED